jgi:hypothetical protein
LRRGIAAGGDGDGNLGWSGRSERIKESLVPGEERNPKSGRRRRRRRRRSGEEAQTESKDAG